MKEGFSIAPFHWIFEEEKNKSRVCLCVCLCGEEGGLEESEGMGVEIKK